MKKIIFIFLFFFLFPLFTNADDNINKVFKIESYEFNELNNSFILKQYWSAVYMEDNLIYTNAHVVLDSENEPIWNYRVCKTTNFKDDPICFTIWKLVYYDVKNDLAVLTIGNPWTDIVIKSDKTLKVWDDVNVYWYPSNWGKTITYTKWKISWYESWFYKIDANIDSGNSWWWVFDSDWNLIWIAFSVKIWYTTLWYIIPIDKINDFKNKINVNSIKNYEWWVNKIFFRNTLTVNNTIWSTNFSNSEIELSNFSKYWFDITYYQVDIDKKFYLLWLQNDNKETHITINNMSFLWMDYDDNIDNMYKDSENEFKKLKENWIISAYKLRKLKIKNKDTLLMFFSDKEWNVSLYLATEISKNNFQFITISSDNIKNKSFLNWVKLVLNSLELNDVVYWDESINYMKLDNLQTWKNSLFFISKTFIWDELTTFWNDIIVSRAGSYKAKTEQYEDYTLSSYIKEDFNYYKDYYYYNFNWIKQTHNWDYYAYSFHKNNEFKWEEIDEEEKKYAITIKFFDYIDEDNFYINSLAFEFDKIELKDKILDFINTIKTSSWKLPLELWDLDVWYNLVEDEDF